MENSPSFIAQVAGRATECGAFARLGRAIGFSASLILSACSSGDGKDAIVSWRLIDGRSCMDTSVAQVTIDVEGGATPGATVTGICHASATDNQLTVKGVRPGAQLHVRAQSAATAVLYRGELRLTDPVPAVIDLPLYYTGGE